MKTLILIAIAFIGLNATAQERDHRQNKGKDHKKAAQFKDMSAEEVATLQTKKMTLDLDLTASQQSDIYNMHLEKTKARKAKRDAREKAKDNGTISKPSKDEKFEKLNTHLDKKIAHKNEMKSILDKDQYQEWERSHKRKGMKRKLKKRRSKRSK